MHAKKIELKSIYLLLIDVFLLIGAAAHMRRCPGFLCLRSWDHESKVPRLQDFPLKSSNESGRQIELDSGVSRALQTAKALSHLLLFVCFQCYTMNTMMSSLDLNPGVGRKRDFSDPKTLRFDNHRPVVGSKAVTWATTRHGSRAPELFVGCRCGIW